MTVTIRDYIIRNDMTVTIRDYIIRNDMTVTIRDYIILQMRYSVKPVSR